MENFDHKTYRDSLASTLLDEKDHRRRKKMLKLAQFTNEYGAAKQLHAKDMGRELTPERQEIMSSEAQNTIQKIIDGLTTAEVSPDKEKEIKMIRTVCQQGTMVKVKPTRVDLMLESKDGEYFLFDIKTAKPNAGGFREFKRTMLEWVAVFLAQNPKAKVNTLIAIPYNPYEPEKYNRWTMRGMLDLDKELVVAEEFWNFLGGKDTFQDLLECFEKVGIELRGEIDLYFKRFNKK